jgi:hypothetical protein
MLESQKHVSSQKLESARLNHLAAKENAKSAMLETYRALSIKDTTLECLMMSKLNTWRL